MYKFDVLASMTGEQRCLYRRLRAEEPVTVRAACTEKLFCIVPNRDNMFHLLGYDIVQDGVVKERGLCLDDLALLDWCRNLQEVLPEGVTHEHVESDLGYVLVHGWQPNWHDDGCVPDMYYHYLHEQCSTAYFARLPQKGHIQRVPLAFFLVERQIHCNECCQPLSLPPQVEKGRETDDREGQV